MPSINPSRLVLARKRNGLTKKELADKAGLTSRSISSFESGTHDPSATTLESLSEALGFPIDFFFAPSVDEPPLEATSFRALSRITARQRDQAVASAAIALQLSRWIDETFSLPHPDVPRMQHIDPETAADGVRREWGLGERSIGNMIHLLEARGVRVFSLAEECAEVDAFSFWFGDQPFVFLNTFKTAEHSRMDAAHELGHLVLHWGHDIPKGREAEREAQAFGSAFLMPRGSVIAEAPRSGRLDQLIASKRRWRVSVAALAYRMHALGLLSDWQYRTLFMEISRLGYRKNEPDGIPRETSQILGKVFQGLRDEGTSKADVARELSIPISELQKVIFGLVITPLSGDGHQTSSDELSGRPDLRVVPTGEST